MRPILKLHWRAGIIALLLQQIPSGAMSDCINEGYLHWVSNLATPHGATGVAVSGTWLYAADGDSGLQVIDVTFPESPQIVGNVDTPGFARGIAVSGSYAYVADDSSGLQVIDIADPAHPVIVGSVDTPGAAFSGAVSGALAYVADDSPGIQVIDVSIPSSPEIIGSVPMPRTPSGIAVAGSFVYVADEMDGLRIVDISNPSQPEVVGAFDTVNTLGLAVAGSHVYLAYNDGLLVIDVTNPAVPSAVDSVDTPGPALGVSILGPYAFVVDGFGLKAVDITDPNSANLVGSSPILFPFRAIASSGSMIYLAAQAGIQIFDASHPTSPAILGHIFTSGGAEAVAVAGSYAYVAAGMLGLLVLDVSNPAAPAVVSTFDYTPTDPAVGIAVSGSYVFMLEPFHGLTVVDVSNPASPTLVSGLSFEFEEGRHNNVAVAFPYCYVAADSGLYVFNIVNPSSWGVVYTEGDPRDIAVDGAYAYVADGYSGLAVIDVLNPTSPTVASSLDLGPGSFARAVTVSGTRAFVVSDRGLEVIDITNPVSPAVVGSIRTADVARDVAVEGGFAYVADSNYGVQIIDVTNPAMLSIVGTMDATLARHLTISGNRLYVARSGNGLTIAQLPCSAPTPVVLSTFQASPGALGILLEWTTSLESDFSGFHVLRSQDMRTGFERITSQLLRSSSPYRYLDELVAPGATYYYRLEAVDRTGDTSVLGLVSATAGEAPRPSLGPALPNPSSGDVVHISFTLAKAGPVVLRIIDVSGREVRRLLDHRREKGGQNVSWDGRDDRGLLVPSGVYVYEIITPELKAGRRLVRLR